MLIQTNFHRLFSRRWKKNLIFRIKQFHNFFQVRRHKFKFIFARRCHMFKFFTFKTTFLFKKNQCFFVNQSKCWIRRKIKQTWFAFEKNLSWKRNWYENFRKKNDVWRNNVWNNDATLLLLIYFIDDTFCFIWLNHIFINTLNLCVNSYIFLILNTIAMKRWIRLYSLCIIFVMKTSST